MARKLNPLYGAVYELPNNQGVITLKRGVDHYTVFNNLFQEIFRKDHAIVPVDPKAVIHLIAWAPSYEARYKSIGILQITHDQTIERSSGSKEVMFLNLDKTQRYNIVDFIGIQKEYRNKGIGTGVMSLINNYCGNIVLRVEDGEDGDGPNVFFVKNGLRMVYCNPDHTIYSDFITSQNELGPIFVDRY